MSLPVLDVPETEVARLLGYPSGWPLEGEVRELVDEARAWCRENTDPTVRTVRLPVTASRNGEVRWPGGVFRSRVLAERLRRAKTEALFAVALSTGFPLEREIDRRMAIGDRVEATFLERFGAAMTEWLAHDTEHSLRRAAARQGQGLLPPLAPGYEDWPLEDQARLFEVFADDPGELELLSSGMLRPRNALLSVFGITPSPADEGHRASRCSRCTWTPCDFRHGKAPSTLSL